MIRSLTILITPEEAILIDWLITMHAYDNGRLEELKKSEWVTLRAKVAPIILKDKESHILLTSNELEYLLIACPMTFRFSEKDIGFSLKKKLLPCLLSPEIIWFKETKYGNDSSSENDSESSTEGSAPA